MRRNISKIVVALASTFLIISIIGGARDEFPGRRQGGGGGDNGGSPPAKVE